MYRLCSPLIVVALGVGPGACGSSDNTTNETNPDARPGIDAAIDAAEPDDGSRPDGPAAEASGDVALPDAGIDAPVPDGGQPDGARPDGKMPDGGADAAIDAAIDQLLPCPAGQLRCAGVCTDVVYHPDHCGACDAACATGEICHGGSCALSCPQGLVKCAGKCVDPLVDPQHCGACGAACGAGEVCHGGACSLFCPPGLVACAGKCIDPLVDLSHCGATEGCGAGGVGTAGASCPGGQRCKNGACVITCGGGTPNYCAGSCVSFQTDEAHCGGCSSGGADHACVPGQLCSAGACVCPTGQVLCDGKCIDPKIDPTYCGATEGCGDGAGSAGQSCAAGTVCSDGGCAQTCGGATPSACAGGCVDHQSNPAHCGGCTSGGDSYACLEGQLCMGGKCECPSGLTLCGGACVNTDYDPSHCGGCSDGGGVDCSVDTPAGALAACVAGGCAYACAGGVDDCNTDLVLGTSGDGCETPLGTNSDCSSCGNVCTAMGHFSAAGQCGGGSCDLVCITGFADCDGDGHCECEGGCAGASCVGTLYYQHSTGRGQTWWDDVPLSTYDQSQATKACEAFRAANPDYGDCKPHQANTSTCGTNLGIATRIPGAIFGNIWIYSGSMAGITSLTVVTMCQSTIAWY